VINDDTMAAKILGKSYITPMEHTRSMKQWPLKILLVHPKAPFMQDEKLTIAADCALLVHKDLVKRFGEESIIIGCPILEDPKRVFEKLKLIFRECVAKTVDVYTMEVPCCHAIHMMIEKAEAERDDKGDIEIRKYIVRVNGDVEPYSGKVDDKMVEAEIKAHRGM